MLTTGLASIVLIHSRVRVLKGTRDTTVIQVYGTHFHTVMFRIDGNSDIAKKKKAVFMRSPK